MPFENINPPLKGTPINGSGTIVTTKFTAGTTASSDEADHVKIGNFTMNVKSAIAMGRLTRQNGSLQELAAPATPTRVNG